jgi:hypothetical protein
MARTSPQLELRERGRTISGCSAPVTAALTNDESTTAAIEFAAFAYGAVANESGGAITITWRVATTRDGTALVPVTEAGELLSAFTVDDGRCRQLPLSLAGSLWLIPVLSSGTATVTFIVKR